MDLVESGDPLGDAAEAGNVELVKKLLKGRGKLKVHFKLLGKILKQGESEAKKRSTTNGKPGFEYAHFRHSIATTLVEIPACIWQFHPCFHAGFWGTSSRDLLLSHCCKRERSFGCSTTGSGIGRLNLGTAMAKPP